MYPQSTSERGSFTIGRYDIAETSVNQEGVGFTKASVKCEGGGG